MPVVKGGVWTNIEDEILKASVSKYGLNQWARVSSLLARKTPKQCKARWSEWLDPGIRKIEWSKEEDEKLLHLAKLMPTQWRTIAPIVGRTATQCLERYQKLLDEAEARENDELGLGGPTGGETAAPSADDVRRLRPGELDPDPESKPARPDTIDLDEDEKEMLSEARARLANTQGKKAKRKARERQLEESRRLAQLQKRRELKNAGINIKITNRKKGQMDYNADVPFEKRAVPGFYDTREEIERNEKQREAFDPRKQQLANKRKQDQQEDDPDRKRRKNEKNDPSAASAAAARAGQMQKIREAEQSSKRRALNLPAPQVGESELEDIVKLGLVGEQANRIAGAGDNEATKGFVGNYTGIVGSTPIRTPRAPPQEDHIANEIRNIRALTETKSSLLGGENTPLHEGSGSTGFDGVTPRSNVVSTPNPMATPMRQGGANGVAATPMRGVNGTAATPLRTPRDNFAINKNDVGGMQLVRSTPKEIRLREQSIRQQLKSKFASLPKPKETEWDLELPEEQDETSNDVEVSEEDAAERDRRNQAQREAAEQAEFKRRTQVLQRGLPRPCRVDIDALLEAASHVAGPIENAIARETALLIANDARKYPTTGSTVEGSLKPLESFEDDALNRARVEIAMEIPSDGRDERDEEFANDWSKIHGTSSGLSGLENYSGDQIDEHQVMNEAFENIQSSIMADAEKGNKLEKKIALHNGGYQQRAKMLRQKIVEASEALEKEKISLDTFQTLQIAEEAALPRRLEALREEYMFVQKREREAQELYRMPATAALVWRAYSRNSLTPAGLVVAALTAVVHAIHPWSVFFALLVVFFLTGTAVTKVKHDVKAHLTLSSTGSSGGESRRTHVQVLANSLVASLLILLHYRQLRDQSGVANQGCWPYASDLLVVGIVSNYAAVAADTFSSELGILSKDKPRLLTSWNFRPVPPGTNGGITLLGVSAGFLGASAIALTSVLLLPFCPIGPASRTGKLFGDNQPGFEGGSGWGLWEKAAWVSAVSFWGGLGSLLDSALGGWLQASVIDERSGKVVEGSGGKKVLLVGSHVKKDGNSSRRVESGINLLDNNAVNLLMAFFMSAGGMIVAAYVWDLPLATILQ
ncbi:MAG: hypothetical protein Q9209_004171 [Squamulea sp. 1 TL-2023]